MNEVNELWKKLRKKKNVVGVSGTPKKKEIGGKETKEECIRVYVKEKIPESLLAEQDVVPEKIDKMRTDVKAIGEIKALTSPFRPAKSGMSAIYEGGTACTLGGFARDKIDGEVVLFANNHCTANENKNKKGHPYLCPSPYDGGLSANKLGELKRYVELIINDYKCPVRSVFGLRTYLTHALQDLGVLQQTFNRVDIGIVNKVKPTDVVNEILQIGQIKGKRRGQMGDLAHKYGRTTGYTKDAKLIDTEWFGLVTYSRGTAPFGPCGLLEGDNFSAGGDSSSLILWKDDDFLAGELFAGSDTHTIYSHYDLMEIDAQLEILI